MSDKLIAVVKDLISHKHEEEWFEFKVNWFEPHELGEYISALSNVATLQGRDCGYFVWGVENNTHKVVGTTFDVHQDVKHEPLKHYLARQLTPDIGFSFDEIQYEGKRLVVLTIPASTKMPTVFDGKRYIRIGSSKENLMKYPEYESQLFYTLRNGMPTVSNTESEYQEMTFNKLFLYFETKGVTLNRRTFKKNLGLLTVDGKFNLLAQLLSDDCHLPIRFAVFAGNNKASTMYSVKEFGYTCILYSLDQVLDYGKLLNIPQADERDRQTVRKEVPLFSAAAFEEAVINAFVHNRWLDGNAPMFTAYQDRIEILSRGNLPPKQTIDGFFAGESIPVNQALSDVFIKLHITEHTGRGVPRITEAYGKDVIRFNENSIVVTVPYERLGQEVYGDGQVIPPVDVPVNAENVPVGAKNAPVNAENVPVGAKNAPVNAENVPVEDEILSFCTTAKNVWEIAEHLGYKDKRSVRKNLNPLIKQGRIAMTIPDKPNSRFQKYVTIR